MTSFAVTVLSMPHAGHSTGVGLRPLTGSTSKANRCPHSHSSLMRIKCDRWLGLQIEDVLNEGEMEAQKLGLLHPECIWILPPAWSADFSPQQSYETGSAPIPVGRANHLGRCGGLNSALRPALPRSGWR